MGLLWLDMLSEKVRAGVEIDDGVVDVDLMIETCLDRERSAANLLLVSFSINDTTNVAKEIQEKGGIEEDIKWHCSLFYDAAYL